MHFQREILTILFFRKGSEDGRMIFQRYHSLCRWILED